MIHSDQRHRAHRTPVAWMRVTCYSCGRFHRMLKRFGSIYRYVAVAYCRVLVVFGLLALCTGFNSNLVTEVSPKNLPSTAQSLVTVFSNFGSTSDVSGRVRIWGTSCAATFWRSNTATLCRASNGAAHTRDTIFPVTATVQSQRSPSTHDTQMIKCRYIRVSTTLDHMQGNGKDGINEGECIAFRRLLCYDASGANVCAHKTASALNTYFIDGDWDTSYPLMSSINMPPYGYHSDGCLPAMGSWWRVDLGAEFDVVSIEFWPRDDGQVQSSSLEITLENKDGQAIPNATSFRTPKFANSDPVVFNLFFPLNFSPFSAMPVNYTRSAALPFTGASLISIIGVPLASFDMSLSVEARGTSFASSVWQSSSSIVSKVFCFVSHAASQVEIAVSLGQQKKFNFFSPNLLTPAATAATPNSNTPVSGSATAVLLGNHLGANSFSARARTSASACPSTRWFSDSSMRMRVGAGVGTSDMSIVLTFHERVAIQLPHFYKLSYDTPSASVATSQRLSNISVFGSGFGSYVSVIPFVASCTDANIDPTQKVSVCSLQVANDDGASASATATVAEAAVRVTFSGSSRLDDVTILLRSPDNKEFVLMRNKCYGSLSCSSTTISFGFQILPVPQSVPGVPVDNCPSSGEYLAEEGESIRSYMGVYPAEEGDPIRSYNSHKISGTWSLMVLAGSQRQNVASASMFLKTGSLDFVIKSSSSTSLAWSSDSSVVMNAPGYQIVQGAETCAGFGRNHSVKVRSSSLASYTSSSCTYSYPDPILNHAIGSVSLPSSGSSIVTFVGRLLSNANPSPLARLGSSSCARTVWQSDTSLLCLHSSFLPRHRIVSFTIYHSAIAAFNSSSSFYPAQIAVASPLLRLPITSASIVSVTGAGFGSSSFSSVFRAAMSSAVSTAWVCDSSISTRVFPAHFFHKSSLLIVSVLSSVMNSTEFEFEHVCTGLACSFPSPTSLRSMNAPASAGTVVSLFGRSFGAYHESMAISLFSYPVSHSACPLSSWYSDSSISCKTPAGLGGASASIAVTVAWVRTITQSMDISFDAPFVDRDVCFVCREVDSTSCAVRGTALRNTTCATVELKLESNASNFGLHQPLRFMVQSGMSPSVNTPCNISAWISDSSVHCHMGEITTKPHSLRIEVIALFLNATSQFLVVNNPFFVPEAPPVNTSISARMYNPSMYNPSSSAFFAEYMFVGKISNFTWPKISNIGSKFEFQEWANVSVFVFIDATQFYLDQRQKPVDKNIDVSLDLVRDNGELLTQAFCKQPPRVSMRLQRETFVAASNVSITFCSPFSFTVTVALVTTYNISDVDGMPVIKNVSSLPFDLKPRGPITLIASDGLPVNFTSFVGVYDGPYAKFTLVTTSSLLPCSSIQFDYVADAVCAYQSNTLALFKASPSLQLKVSSVSGTSNSCEATVAHWSFVRPAQNCTIRFAIPSLNLTSMSQPFSIAPGKAVAFVLIGNITCASAGALIWSIANQWFSKHVAIQLLDVEGNNATKAGVVTTLFAKDSSGASYSLAGNVANSSDASGMVRWTSAYSGLIWPLRIVLGVRLDSSAEHIFSAADFAVNSSGPPSTIIVPTTPAFNETLRPGQLPPSLTFSLKDVGGNPITSVAGLSVAIRVRLVPRNTANFPRRRLHQVETASNSAQCDGDVYTIFNLSAVTGALQVGIDRVCTAGENMIVYDIGTYDETGNFITTFSNVMSTIVTVIPGASDSFMLQWTDSDNIRRSYQMIDNMEVVFRDSGLNIVSGNATMTVVSSNMSAILSPDLSFSVSSNVSVYTQAFVPPFFVALKSWNVLKPLQLIHIRVNRSTLRSYGAVALVIKLNATCQPGQRIVSSGLMVIAGASSVSNQCIACNETFYTSIFYDSTDCITLLWSPPDLPMIVTSGKPLPIVNIKVVNQDGAVMTKTSGWKVRVSLVNFNQNSTSSIIEAVLENGISLPVVMTAPIYAEKPAIDYNWRLQLLVNSDSTALSLMLPSEKNVRVLDVAPFVHKAAPQSLSFGGSSGITLTSSFISMVPITKYAFATNAELPIVRNDTCLFVPRGTTLPNISIPANRSLISETVIQFVCGGVLPALSGPPFTVWDAIVLLSDGRESNGNASLESFCPIGYYIDYQKPPQSSACVRCPVGSTSLKENTNLTSPCICDAGYYGSFGMGCKRCPQLSGYSCTTPDQVRPIVLPGYYGDYSLLPNCDWRATSCAALLTCPYGERSCPGGGDKLCTQNDAECYTGLACSACCPSYYLENGICHQCPDSSTSTTIFAVMVVVVIIVAILMSTSQSASFTHSIKYFILGLNFFQNLVSIKLISIEWPIELLQLFSSLRFFSFSLSAVRPECSFAWTFETKIGVTLMLPLVLSLIVCLMGVVYGAWSCRRLFERIQQLRSDGAKLPHMSMSSLVNCWLHVVFFRPIEWKPRYFMWFALSPYLESRALGRQLETSTENWAVLRSTLKSRFRIGRIFGVMRKTNQVQPVISDYDVKGLQLLLHNAELDASFASVVFKGRKFASGVVSIMVISFVGTLTSAIGAAICEERDSKMFLVQDPTIECNLASSRYASLFAIAIGAIVLYAIVVPGFLVLLLRSQWSLTMRACDRSGYDALFGFLTSRYSLNCYMWETVMFVYKGLCVVIPATYSGSPLQQSVGMMFVSFVYVMLLFKFSPFANGLMNAVEKAAAFSIFLMYFTAVIFVCEVDSKPILDKTQKSLVGICLCIVCATSVAFCFASAVYEYYYLLLFHGDVFISKWARAFEAAIGDSLSESLFSYFYTFYNPKSRRSVVTKKRQLNESIAILMAFKHSEAWKSGSMWVRFKLHCAHLWQWLRFAIKKRNYSECQPMIVREALEYPEARLLQRLSKILHYHKNSTTHKNGTETKGDGFVSKLARLCGRLICRKQIRHPQPKTKLSSTTMLTELDPPAAFMEKFSEKIDFVSDALSDESIRVLLTILIFDREDDMGDSQAAKAYLQLMRREFFPMKSAVQSVFLVVQDITQAEEQAQQDQSWIVRSLKSTLLGHEGACLLRFLTLSNRETGELFSDKGFEDFSMQEMLVIPVSELVSAQSQMLSNSVPEIQAIPTSQCSRPQLYAAHKIRSAMDAGQSIGATPAAKLPSASDSDSIESLKLKLEAMSEEMSILKQLQEKEIAVLKEANARALGAKDKEISVLQEHNARTLYAKDNEISALQATTAFLMRKSHSLSKIAESVLLQAEIQSLKDAGAAPEVIHAKYHAAEEALKLAMAADEPAGMQATDASHSVSAV